MQRKILIVDDHDDLKSALSEVFAKIGFNVIAVAGRAEALAVGPLSGFDLVITDLDGAIAYNSGNAEDETAACLPRTSSPPGKRSKVRAFKISATNFRREHYDEDELKNIFETVLSYKATFLDKDISARHVHEKIEFEFPSTLSLMTSILDYLIKRAARAGVVDASRSNLFVALDEAIVNAVKHGNKFDSGKIIRISADVSSTEARFTIEDEGEGFDVNQIPDPCDPENLFKTSGRGVFFIHNIMDEVAYNERGNRLTMIKKKTEENA